MDEGQEGIQSRILIGYEYVPGYERLVNGTTVFEYAKIYSKSVNFCEGASPSYTLTVTKSTTKTTGWNISGSLSGEFKIKVVKTKLQGTVEHEDKETATISKGQMWDCGFSVPGLYNLTWYMRGYQYTCQCGAKYMSTDSNDGRFTYYNLGTGVCDKMDMHAKERGRRML